MEPETWAERVVVNHLATQGAERASEFFLAWAERRNASWGNAHRDAEQKAASSHHLAGARGQFRHIYGETAVKEAAAAAKVGCLPIVSTPLGGVFMTARVGRFALSSVVLRNDRSMPRRSATRTTMSGRNYEIDPQVALDLPGASSTQVVTELAYFGCLVSMPCWSDPTVPSRLLIAVPDASLTRWALRMELYRLHALLQNRVISTDVNDIPKEDGEIPDNVFSTLRVAKQNKGAADDSVGG